MARADNCRENCIRTVSKTLEKITLPKTGVTRKKIHQRLLGNVTKRLRRRAIRYGILAANIVLLAGVLIFVLNAGPSEDVINQSSAMSSSVADQAINPLDQLSSAEIAVHVARLARLDESNAAANHADSANALLGVSPSEQTIVAKPQIVATAFRSSKDIQAYVAKLGDTVVKLAKKFDVTSDTLRWSNNLSANEIPAGTTIYVLPGVNGIIRVVQSGDTPASLAAKYHANKDQIIAYNDAEISGLKVGRRIIIPNGELFAAPAPVPVVASFAARYGAYNGYDWGYCTWYVANKISVPNNWGNANTWDYWARQTSGWTVNSAPKVGAVGQTKGGYLGHVTVIEAVSPDGKQVKYSDMNGLAGYSRVGFSGWVPVSHFVNYIYR